VKISLKTLNGEVIRKVYKRIIITNGVFKVKINQKKLNGGSLRRINRCKKKLFKKDLKILPAEEEVDVIQVQKNKSRIMKILGIINLVNLNLCNQ
jgi:hypothetical protein